MKLFSILLFSVIGSIFLFWSWTHYPNFRNSTLSFLYGNKFQTLEIRYSAENIMDEHKNELLKNSLHSFLSPKLIFHPYLLMEVKYLRTESKTKEGFVLWSLVDGEMVINTASWEMTHGFIDCIQARADKDDFKVINTLASKGGSLDRESLAKMLNLEDYKLNTILNKCIAKNLILQIGNSYRLHLENPELEVKPETKIDQWIVTKSMKNIHMVPGNFFKYQIEAIAKAAFGNDFTIRKETEVFLPVYCITVQNPDGSVMSTYWNAVNGKKLNVQIE